jgi:hypothetical protein
VGIVSAVVLLLAILALFLFRTLAGREPSHVAVVQGNERWLGAELTVSGPSLPRPYEARIDRSDRCAVPFFLPAGSYELRVRAGGVDVYRKRFELGAEPKVQIILPTDLPTTQPTTRVE